MRVPQLRPNGGTRVTEPSADELDPAHPGPSALEMEVEMLQKALERIPSNLESLPLDSAAFPIRAINALKRRGIAELGELKSLGAQKFVAFKNIGSTTVRAVRKAISNLEGSPGEPTNMAEVIASESATVPPTIDELWQDILAATSSTDSRKTRSLKIILDRFGLLGSAPRTLEEIGRDLGVTRERIRQIESSVLRRLHQPSRRAFSRSTRIVARQTKQNRVAMVSEVFRVERDGLLHPDGMSHLVARVSGEYDVIGGKWMVPRGGLPTRISRPLIDGIADLPADISWTTATSYVRSRLNRAGLSDEVAVGLLAAALGDRARTLTKSDGTIVGIRHRTIDLGEASYLVLQEAGKPLTLRALGSQVLSRYGKWSPSRMEQKVGTAIQNDDRFVQIGSGTYDLEQRFPISSERRVEILDSAYELLKSLRRPTDTAFILKRIRQQLYMPPDLNRYCLYSLIRRDPRFRPLRRLHVGLSEWSEKPEAPFAETLLTTLEEAGSPLTEHQIYRQLSALRAPHFYGVSQALERLARQGLILKLAPQTFAAFSVLHVSDEIRSTIRESVGGFIVEHGLPIVARFFREWLVPRQPAFGEITNFQVDAVLAQDANLERIGYGVYVPRDAPGDWKRDPVAAHASILLRRRGEPALAAEIVWALEEAHSLPGSRIWERLLTAHEIQIFPQSLIGLREWCTSGWAKAIAMAWHDILPQLSASRGVRPEWLSPEAEEALIKVATNKGEDWLIDYFGLRATAGSSPPVGSSDPRPPCSSAPYPK